MSNFLYLSKMFEKIKGVDGNVVECGVGYGRTFLILSYLVLRENKGREIWGFDSFRGFPEPSLEDTSPRKPVKGEWSGTSPEDIIKILKRAGLPMRFLEENVRMVEGFFENSLRKYDGSPIAFLHIDADLYKSYKIVLENLFPLVSEGGLVLFDEYNEPNWPGAKRAVDEYFTRTPYKVSYDKASGKYFVIRS